MRSRLLALGALYLACTIGILSLSALVDGGELLSFMLSSKATDREVIESGDFALPALFVMLLMTPVVMAYWFAPVLAAWHGLGVGKSLFFSLVACWINWRAFLVYGMLWVMVFMGTTLLVSLLASLLDGEWATSMLLPATLMLAAMFFCSTYFSFRDSFLRDAHYA